MKVKIYEKMKNEKMIPVKQFYEQWILIGNVEEGTEGKKARWNHTSSKMDGN